MALHRTHPHEYGELLSNRIDSRFILGNEERMSTAYIFYWDWLY